ncbi:hypothetical protein AVEN_248974-1 [Araneus ventricosus]|uniref:Uncharacterized protein n=1 Tax=Araneus ventricosus TaxID=182803 RepID=A0A4Y2J4J9_ARAVE|nr:hypothetical protein AVEN_248974-1 [Araneus ventricosus]
MNHKGTSITLREFWKYYFHIVACLTMIENMWEASPRKPSFQLGRSFGRVLSNVTLRGSRQLSVKPTVNEIVPLAKIMGLEEDNYIDELVAKSWPPKSLRSCIVFHSKKLWRRVCQRKRYQQITITWYN